jgi:NifU-like protein
VKTPVASRLTNIQKIRLLEETLEREIKPALQNDGGDIELVDFDNDRALVRLAGNCATCKASQITLKGYVEAKLQELVSPEITVEEVQ